MQGYINRTRSIRHELGKIAISNSHDENGMILVPVTLCRRETSVYIVDTGARAVTVPPALVEALGLTDQIGEAVDVSLAGGLRISGPELIIPQLSVDGMEAENVRAVVLKEPMVGVDGLLGLSFLNRFSYRIEKKGWGDTKLILKALKTRN